MKEDRLLEAVMHLSLGTMLILEFTVTVLGTKKSSSRFNLRDENIIATEKRSLTVRDDKSIIVFYIRL